MYIKWLTGYPKDLIRDVTLIKQSGVKCTDVLEVPLVETATGKIAQMCYQVTFKGNFFQHLKALKIMKTLHKD